MFQRLLLGILTAFALVGFLSPPRLAAQIFLPPNIPNIPFPKMQRLPPDLQQELEQLLDLDAMLQQELGRGVPRDGTLVRWGGLRLKKVTPAMQEKLGLPDHEGLIVAAVDPSTPGDKAGLQANDVLVKINDKAVPNDAINFAKLVKDQKADEAVDIVVLRKGKEETIKGVKMPAVAQANPNPGGGNRLMIRPGLGGLGGLGGLMFQRLNINPNAGKIPKANLPLPAPAGKIENLHLEMNIDGAKIVRTQTAEQFSGAYAKDNVKVAVMGSLANGVPKISEITVQEGKETKKFTNLTDVPLPHRRTIEQMLLPSSNSFLPLRGLPLPPNIPRLDDA